MKTWYKIGLVKISVKIMLAYKQVATTNAEF